MTTAMSLCLLFLAKMADNALSTVKTIMIQRNRSLLAGVAIALSSLLYFWITRSVVLADSLLTTMTVAVASGVGCFLVSRINNKLSKDRTYVNVVMSDDMAAMQDFRDYLRFLYKGIIIKHNKTEPTYTKTSLFLCEKRRFLWPGLRKEGNLFKLAGPGGLAFFHLTKKEVSKWPMKK